MSKPFRNVLLAGISLAAVCLVGCNRDYRQANPWNLSVPGADTAGPTDPSPDADDDRGEPDTGTPRDTGISPDDTGQPVDTATPRDTTPPSEVGLDVPDSEPIDRPDADGGRDADAADTTDADTTSPDTFDPDTGFPDPDAGTVPPPQGTISQCQPDPKRVVPPPNPQTSGPILDQGGFIEPGVQDRLYTLQIDPTPARDQFRVWDVSTPSNPTVVGTQHLRQSPMGLAARGRFAFVLQLTHESDGFTYRIHSIDAEQPGGPTRLSTIDMVDAVGSVCRQGWNAGRRGKMALIGSNVYLLCSDRIAVVDVSNPCKPTAELASWDAGGDLRAIVGWRRESGGYRAVVESKALGTDPDLQLVQLDRRVRTLASRTFPSRGGTTPITFDAAVGGGQLYGDSEVLSLDPTQGLATLGTFGSAAGNRVAARGTEVAGDRLYDLSDPANPVVIQNLRPAQPTGGSGSKGVDLAFVHGELFYGIRLAQGTTSGKGVVHVPTP